MNTYLEGKKGKEVREREGEKEESEDVRRMTTEDDGLAGTSFFLLSRQVFLFHLISSLPPAYFLLFPYLVRYPRVYLVCTPERSSLLKF